jgi:hypothetical protein
LDRALEASIWHLSVSQRRETMKIGEYNMGRGDNRRTKKVKQKRSQRKKKAREKKKRDTAKTSRVRK